MPAQSAFPYPGGKGRYADWIIDHFPPHEIYVEPFCGSCDVFIRKDRSHKEALNDVDEDIVTFFRVLRDEPDELINFLQAVPYSEQEYHEWADAFFAGERPTDPVERAARFYFLSRTSFGSKMENKSGFIYQLASNSSQRPLVVRNAVDELEKIAYRLRAAVITSGDYSVQFERFDTEETLFYCDPPYVGTEGRYKEGGGFNHKRFVEALDSLEGYWICSYGEIPDHFDEMDVWVAQQDATFTIDSVGGHKEATESLIMNFDPEGTPTWSPRVGSTMEDDW